jgi:hypothetical protein
VRSNICTIRAYPGVETPVTPDGPDVLDGGDGVEAAQVGGRRRVGQVELAYFVVIAYAAESRDELPCRHQNLLMPHNNDVFQKVPQ